LLDAYLLSESFEDKSEQTQKIDLGRIERHLRPLLGKRHAHLLTDNDIKKALTAIREGKTATKIKTGSRGLARVTGGNGTARMAIDLLRSIFNFAISERMVKANPCMSVKTGTSGIRETILEDAADYARLFQTLDRMEQELRIRQPVADAIRLIALTGCRRGEAAGLRWRHVDMKRGRIVLQSHKTGKRSGKPKIIALPSAAQAIIAHQPGGGPDDFVFAPARGDGAMSLSAVWRKIRQEAGLPVGIGLHGLRHSVGSHMAMAGAQAPEIMTALGHNQLSTVQRYIHWAEDSRQVLAEKAATVALAGMAAASKPKGKVLRLKGREQ
jgi:integrase